MGLNELSGVLWRERQLLELLLFKLEEEQLILTHGRTQWLGHATREVESVLDQIRTAELARSVEADEAAHEIAAPEGSSLRALAELARPPWDYLLREHHQAFVSLTAQIGTAAEDALELLALSIDATQVMRAADGIEGAPVTVRSLLADIAATLLTGVSNDPPHDDIRTLSPRDPSPDRPGVQDPTLAETRLDRRTHDVVHECALAATTRVLQPTLLDFLR